MTNTIDDLFHIIQNELGEYTIDKQNQILENIDTDDDEICDQIIKNIKKHSFYKNIKKILAKKLLK